MSASTILPSMISSEQQFNLCSDALSALNIIHGGVDVVSHLDCTYNLRYRRQRIGYEPGNRNAAFKLAAKMAQNPSTLAASFTGKM